MELPVGVCSMTLILLRLASNSNTWSSLYLREQRGMLMLISLWTHRTDFFTCSLNTPSFTINMTCFYFMGNCNFRDAQGWKYLSDFPNILISMVSPLVPLKATPILRKTNQQSKLEFLGEWTI